MVGDFFFLIYTNIYLPANYQGGVYEHGTEFLYTEIFNLKELYYKTIYLFFNEIYTFIQQTDEI